MSVVSVIQTYNLILPVIQKQTLYNSVKTLPMFEEMKKANLIRMDGGDRARFPVIVDTPSDPTELSLSSTSVNISGRDIHTTVDVDWGTRAYPIIMRNEVLRRLQTKEQVSNYIKDYQTAMETGRRKGYYRQLLVGNMAGYTRYGTINGSVTGLSALGVENGALQFTTKALQFSGGTTYLNRARNYDSTLESFAEDNHYNHYETHAGIGTNFIATCEKLKSEADQFGDGESDSVQNLLISQANLTGVMNEFRNTVGGNSSISYTTADVTSGKAFLPVHVIAGMKLQPTPVISLMETATGLTEIGVGLNPMSFMQLINKGQDAQAHPVKDWMPDKGEDISVGFIIDSNQLACRSLCRNFVTRRA